MRFYRLFPYDPDAALTEKGGALFIPRGSAGRADNPTLYAALYMSNTPEGAVAEAFGRLPLWRPVDFMHPSGFRISLAAYDVPDDLALCDLDDVSILAELGIRRPSHVVTRDRKRTQSWAQRVYDTGKYAGVQWWCYYNPDWRSAAIWDLRNLNLDQHIEPLDASHAIVKNTAAAIVRQIDSAR